jgi:hypothetical protein
MAITHPSAWVSTTIRITAEVTGEIFVMILGEASEARIEGFAGASSGANAIAVAFVAVNAMGAGPAANFEAIVVDGNEDSRAS